MNNERNSPAAQRVAQVEKEYADLARKAGAHTPQMPRTDGVVDKLVALASVDSTNILARKMLANRELDVIDAEGRPGMVALCADAQSAGHGRLGRQWSDEAGGASFLVTYVTALPEWLVTDSHCNGWFTIIAGLAALDALNGALDKCGAKPIDPSHGLELKWPNDIFYDGHKLGGILTEVVLLPDGMDNLKIAEYGGREAEEFAASVMFGIGINLGIARESLPTPISSSLQLLYSPLPDPATMRDMVAARLATSLKRRLAAFVDDPQSELPKLLEETRGKCWTLGRQVEAKFTDGSTLTGKALLLNADASLTVQDEHGAFHVVKTADVGVLA
ncbi:biotin--[acetyl-CoA-carboxylase] ligase [Bifidobacterium sp. ESL0745]|uniref:biotin--[acetyl-CoA-carboxylase] ligase n=1 Tax=Bifidobacterium sp. ESL0745 TaxID=2983226 RepID=UPI0023F730B6|nr:biotin--[acetyl-CoA-carboxylase] ligase [Bifidobacterium sp. ESL0745]MDF7666202.1 biotin--[acetyl-CoA-carboxylase] ligase [Bifidobacterium sp. ESL0745]